MGTSVSLEQIDLDLERTSREIVATEAQLQNLRVRHAWLESKREALLEYLNWAGGGGATEPAAAQAKKGAQDGGTSIPTWAKIALCKLPPGSLQETWPLIRLMQEAGFESTAEKLYLTVYGSLHRIAKRPDGEIVKVGPRWGLREWYPDGIPEYAGKFNLEALNQLSEEKTVLKEADE